MSTLAPPRQDAGAGDVRVLISRVPYLPGLDGLRALAVVAVMVYHANSDWLPGGFLGVEVFFVISGYLITLLLIAERERNYRISLRQFWFRRARRLLPALYTMMLLVTVWTAMFKYEALGQLRGDVIAGFFYVSNWYQIWTGLGYTAAGDFAPLRHLWSLAVEEQFYLLWPVVMIVLLGRRGTRRVADVSRWLVVGALVIYVAVAMLFYGGTLADPSVTPDAYWWIGSRPISKIDTLYLSTLTRLAGIMLGSAFAMLWRPVAIMRGPLRTKGNWFDGFALVAIVFCGWLCWHTYLATPAGADPFLFRGGLLLVAVATIGIIAAITHRGARTNQVLGVPLLRYIGTRSYGLYLYHWPIYQMIRGVAGNKLSFAEFAFAMAITAAITEVSYRFIETPIRRGHFLVWWRQVRSRPARGPRLALAGAAALVAVVGVGVGATMFAAPLEQNEIARALDDGGDFTTDLLNADRSPGAPMTTTSTTSTTPVTTSSLPAEAPVLEEGTVPADSEPDVTAPPATEAPATTVAPPPTTPAPVAQLGVVTSLDGLAPLVIPPTTAGFPLVALGDSVMLGAAEELQARGFQVDAVQSRQMSSFIPAMQALRDNGTFGSVVVIHLGTNGGFSDETLEAMLATVADVPVVLLLTGKADRGWIAENNARIRAAPERHPNVSVIDWESLSATCEGNCFYDDGIHLTQSGQDFYAAMIGRVLGQP